MNLIGLFYEQLDVGKIMGGFKNENFDIKISIFLFFTRVFAILMYWISII